METLQNKKTLLIHQKAEPGPNKQEFVKIQIIIQNLKTLETPGEDEVNPQLFKLVRKDCMREIYLLLNYIYY